MDRVIRTTVGLRPVRQSGFLLRADRLDDKVLIHNYGHGGTGMTLSWGTGFLAANLAMAHPERRAAVIGCGIVGLTAARQLQRRGFDVTIYAMDLPPNTTSNMSLANFEAGPLRAAQVSRPGMQRRSRTESISCLSVPITAFGGFTSIISATTLRLRRPRNLLRCPTTR